MSRMMAIPKRSRDRAVDTVAADPRFHWLGFMPAGWLVEQQSCTGGQGACDLELALSAVLAGWLPKVVASPSRLKMRSRSMAFSHLVLLLPEARVRKMALPMWWR